MQTLKNQKLHRDIGDRLETVTLNGNVGDVHNYVTLENYGQMQLREVKLRK